jgi:carbonic anhydrase/acetyltransferase-like protein (isoleucine patch superfamily)
MGKPTIVQHFRQTLGRALRETGQALDRLGIKGHQLAVTKQYIGDDPVIYEDHLSRHRHQMPLLRRGRPIVSPDVAFLAPCSTLIGSVHIGANSSVFYKAILRADNCDHAESFTTEGTEEWELNGERFTRQHTQAMGGGIFIGENTNIQDGCIIDSAKDHTRIGNGVTVGHLASIHSATVHDHSLIGMGALLQEGVVVKEESFVAAGANVTAYTIIESGELWVGNPARKIRDLTPEERQKLHYQANQVRHCCLQLICFG